MKFLGTGAAELLPNPLCTCEVCERARIERAIPRRRSALIYDDTLCIDFGPDIFAAAQQWNVRLHYLRDVLITHTHVDHLSCFVASHLVDGKQNASCGCLFVLDGTFHSGIK